MQSYNPAVLVSLSQDYWMVAKQVNKKNAGKPRVLAINSLLHSLAALAATFSDVAFYWHLQWWKATAKVNLSEFDVSRIRPRLGGLLQIETFTGT